MVSSTGTRSDEDALAIDGTVGSMLPEATSDTAAVSGDAASDEASLLSAEGATVCPDKRADAKEALTGLMGAL